MGRPDTCEDTCDQIHVKIKGNQAFIDGKPSINKTGSQYIDGPPVIIIKEIDGVPAQVYL